MNNSFTMPRRCLQPPRCRRPGRVAGFTLVELAIAVVVVAVLAALAYPSMMGAVRKSRRSEAFTALAAMQQAQERWRSTHAAYTSALTDLNVTSPTPSSYYQLTATADTTSPTLGYVVTADGSGSSQADDGQCAKLSVQVMAGDVKYASCKSCSSFSYSAADPCWSR